MTASTTTSTIPGYRAGTWAIDAAHSEVAFAVRHMMVSKVRGRFTEFSGTLVTGETVETSSVEAEIDLQSVTTGNPQRDEHLRSPDFFETDVHPKMIFRSTSVRPDGDAWVITGDLSLKGITRSVDLETELVGIGPDAYGGVRAGFAARTTINRRDFNVNWSAAIEGGGVVVSDKVEIVLDIQAVLQA
jgi:polyisoprenoid-binding protein YceI